MGLEKHPEGWPTNVTIHYSDIQSFEHPPRLWIDVPNAFPWRKCLHAWGMQVGGDQVSGLNQVITISCSFEKGEEKAQQFVLTPLQVPLLHSFQNNLKMFTQLHTHS